jgi:hypothetical protein
MGSAALLPQREALRRSLSQFNLYAFMPCCLGTEVTNFAVPF